MFTFASIIINLRFFFLSAFLCVLFTLCLLSCSHWIECLLWFGEDAVQKENTCNKGNCRKDVTEPLSANMVSHLPFWQQNTQRYHSYAVWNSIAIKAKLSSLILISYGPTTRKKKITRPKTFLPKIIAYPSMPKSICR